MKNILWQLNLSPFLSISFSIGFVLRQEESADYPVKTGRLIQRKIRLSAALSRKPITLLLCGRTHYKYFF